MSEKYLNYQEKWSIFFAFLYLSDIIINLGIFINMNYL